MANIDSQLAQLEDGGTDGYKSRSIIVDILNTLNTKGMNASTLGTMSPDHFVPKTEFNNKFNVYLRKIGLVYDFVKLIDEESNTTILTQYYKKGTPSTPFDVKKSNIDEFVDTSETISLITNDSSGTYNAPFDITLPTSNAVWQLLHYSDLQELQSYIND